MNCKKFFISLLWVCTAFILSGCSDNPEDILEKYFKALRDGDSEMAAKYSASYAGHECTEERRNHLFSEPDILDVEYIQDGERAIVTFQNEFVKGDELWLCQLLKRDGEWFITGFSTVRKR